MYRGPALGRHSKLFSMREALREDAARVGDISEDSHPKHGLGSLNIFRLTLTHLINVSRTVRNGLPTLPRPAWRRHRFNLMSSDTDKMLQRTAVWSPWQAYRLGSIVVGFPLPSTNSCRDGCRAQGAYSDCPTDKAAGGCAAAQTSERIKMLDQQQSQTRAQTFATCSCARLAIVLFV